MKTILLSIVLLLLFSALNAQVFTPTSFFSKALDKDMEYYVSYPDGYNTDTEKNFPVIIFLHGAEVGPDSYADPINEQEALFRIAYPDLFKTILIMPNGQVEPYLGSFYTNSELYGDYENYIMEDLIEHVRKTYRVIEGRRGMSIMGHSMGGIGSMKLALKYPDQFAGIASLSGPLNIVRWQELLPLVLAENGGQAPYGFEFEGSGTKTQLAFSMAGAFSPNLNNETKVDFPIKSDGTKDDDVLKRWAVHNPAHLVASWGGDPTMGVYFYCGTNDDHQLFPQNENFKDSLDFYGVENYVFKQDDGDHSNKLIIRFPEAVEFLINVMDTTTNLVDAIAEFQESEVLKIYPNPMRDQLVVDGIEVDSNIRIYSVVGKPVFQVNNVKEERFVWNPGALSSGIYFIEIQHGGSHQVYRFVKL
ncbi:T9SS type A sorting domain-containing protein [Puteibacter caeruleilacunae]|nr:T9SS type A sorting domain-containing protein [Puteibacter caeruleilacunae]